MVLLAMGISARITDGEMLASITVKVNGEREDLRFDSEMSLEPQAAAFVDQFNLRHEACADEGRSCMVRHLTHVMREKAFVTRASGGGSPGEVSDDDATYRDFERNLDSQQPYFVLFRQLGNDLPPYHTLGQTRWNLEYVLRHEGALRGCRKKWLLHRLVSGRERKLTLELLRQYGYTVEGGDVLEIPVEERVLTTESDEAQKDHVLNINLAKNLMLERGRAEGYRWTLAFDGNQFLTDEAWGDIVRSAARAEAGGQLAVHIFMYRIEQLQEPSWLNASTRFSDLTDPSRGGRELLSMNDYGYEGQLMLRSDAGAGFATDAGHGYGREPKYELLKRLRCTDPDCEGIKVGGWVGR